ncbi:MAG: DUF924 domain-containing protein [Rhodospirillaceae bacterium]|nr:DUF924 domain-containing protein [Rhodospirillaceae bacterium]
MTGYSEVLAFWFGDPGDEDSNEFRDAWFGKDDAFDSEVRSRFAGVVAKASAGDCDAWQETPDGALALTIVLDQFSRNIFRRHPTAFATDARARSVARRALDRGFDRRFPTMQKLFFYLPFQHSENLADQRRGVAHLTTILGDFDGALYERFHFAIHRHCEIIERFGRFPHRNETLGRATSAAEAAFLEEPRSSFG